MNSDFRKSSYSGGMNSNCVEIGSNEGATLIRDTKQAGVGPVLSVPAGAWSAFLATIR